MNQRGRKTYSASANDNTGMGLVTFLKTAKEVVASENEDAAFYFEQIEDWLRDGNFLSTSRREIERMLGL